VKLVLRAAGLIRVCRVPAAMFPSGTRCVAKTGKIKKRLRIELQAMTRTWDVHVWDDHVNFWLPEWWERYREQRKAATVIDRSAGPAFADAR